jgi:hypothetical protein
MLRRDPPHQEFGLPPANAAQDAIWQFDAPRREIRCAISVGFIRDKDRMGQMRGMAPEVDLPHVHRPAIASADRKP